MKYSNATKVRGFYGMAKKVRVGLVGAGNIAQNAHLPAYMRRDDIELTAICDINRERADEVGKKFGFKEVYYSADEMMAKADIDYVDICVWNGSHAPVAIAAAKAGRAIMCEKPMAINLEAALAMKKAIEEAGVMFMMAMPNRFRHDVSLLREMVDAGKLGEVYYAKTAIIRRRGTPLGWFTDLSKAGGGPVIDIGVHCIDRTWYLMGCPKPVRVSAMTHSLIGDYKTKGVGRWVALDSDVTAFDTEDSAEGVIHFENGAAMIFEVSWALNAEPCDYSVICGDKAGASLTPFTIYGEDMGYLTDNSPTVAKPDNFYLEIDHFLNCFRTGNATKCPLEHGVTVQRMLQGIYDSAKAKKEVIL